MQTMTHLEMELSGVLERAEVACRELPGGADHHALNDHRAAVLGDLFDALDRVIPGLGTRYLVAMFPGADAFYADARTTGASAC